MFKAENSLHLGVFDINGTIHTTQDGVSNAIIEGFENLEAQDIQSTIITGRSIHRARMLLASAWDSVVSDGLPVSVENGARLVRPDGTNARFHAIEAETQDAVIDAVDKADEPVRYVAFSPEAIDARSVLWLPEDGSPEEYIESNGDHVEVVRGPLTGFAARMACDGAGMVRIGAAWGEVADFLKHTNAFVNQDEVNVLAEGIDKATGVQEIAEHTGVSLEKVFVAGNDHNDLPMFDLPVAEKIFVAGSSDASASPEAATVRIDTPVELGKYLQGLQTVGAR